MRHTKKIYRKYIAVSFSAICLGFANLYFQESAFACAIAIVCGILPFVAGISSTAEGLANCNWQELSPEEKRQDTSDWGRNILLYGIVAISWYRLLTPLHVSFATQLFLSAFTPIILAIITYFIGTNCQHVPVLTKLSYS